MGSPLGNFVASVTVQTAVYWGNPTPDGTGGYAYSAPREIKVRWDGKIQLVVNRMGEQVTSSAELLVNEDLDSNGYLFLGFLVDLNATELLNPKKVDGAFPILGIVKVPEFRSTTEFVRTVFL